MATQSQKGSQTGTKSVMSDARRERLLDIQKREQLKGLLVNKFKLKYGDKPNIASYIDNEVQKFLKNDRLTEDNLKKLDDKILREAELRDKKDQIQEDRKSNVGSRRAASQRPGTTISQRGAGLDLEVKSVASSRMSGASKISKQSKNREAPAAGGKQFDQLSLTSSQQQKTEIYSEIDEDDEWAAIQKFNTLLHYEEQKQAILRDKERKRLIREELEKQLNEKKGRKYREVEENNMYEKLQEQHVKLLEDREVEKNRELKKKIMHEKESRDKQLVEEKSRKKVESREQFRQEIDLVKRLQQEMDQERQMLLEKRRQEREYLQKMLTENDRQKAKTAVEKEKERLEDVRAQQEYARMLEKQELDRINEFKAREQRAQEFMNRMADTVIKTMDDKQREEEDKIRRYEMEKEMRERLEDEKKMKKIKDEQRRMRDFLGKQMDEKKHRENLERALNDEQAVMWKQDQRNYTEEERRLMDKINKINKENADFLKRQMDDKNGKNAKMNKQEFLLNKQLLREINDKKKTTYYGGSMRDGENQEEDYQQ